MSVLIEGINLPKTEGESALLILAPGGKVISLSHAGGKNEFEAVEVREPHGDLIEREALFHGEHNLYCWDEIEEVPAIIPASGENVGNRPEQPRSSAMTAYELGKFETLDMLATAWYGKQYYFPQENDIVYSRESVKNMTLDDAIAEFANKLIQKD